MTFKQAIALTKKKIEVDGDKYKTGFVPSFYAHGKISQWNKASDIIYNKTGATHASLENGRVVLWKHSTFGIYSDAGERL